nr:hypothetical protein CFP56_20267 [Quercus suber]
MFRRLIDATSGAYQEADGSQKVKYEIGVIIVVAQPTVRTLAFWFHPIRAVYHPDQGSQAYELPATPGRMVRKTPSRKPSRTGHSSLLGLQYHGLACFRESGQARLQAQEALLTSIGKMVSPSLREFKLKTAGCQEVWSAS